MLDMVADRGRPRFALGCCFRNVGSAVGGDVVTSKMDAFEAPWGELYTAGLTEPAEVHKPLACSPAGSV